MIVSVLVLLVVLVPTGLGFVTLWGVTHPRCSSGPTPEALGLAPQDVSVPSRHSFDFPGYFFPGTNGATIIIPPAYGQDRTGWLQEAAVLIRAGYGVLTFDSRTCQGIAPHSLGYWEADDILDAVDYLRARGDVDMARVGAHGFSQAGASALLAAAHSTELRAVAAEGGYLDYGAQTLSIGQTRDLFLGLFGLGAQLGYRAATGLDLSLLRPEADLAAIAPRQVLLVYGQYEVTLAGARQAAETHDHVRLWEVPGATHGSYLRSAGEAEFRQHVVGFFDEALRPPES
jgi:dienelactone hydrolase